MDITKAREILKTKKIYEKYQKKLAWPLCEMEVIADVCVYEGQKRRI